MVSIADIMLFEPYLAYLWANFFSSGVIASSNSISDSVHAGLSKYVSMSSSQTSATRRLLNITKRTRSVRQSSVQHAGEGETCSSFDRETHRCMTKDRRFIRSSTRGIFGFFFMSVLLLRFAATLLIRYIHSASNSCLNLVASSTILLSSLRRPRPILVTTACPNKFPILPANVRALFPWMDIAFVARTTTSKCGAVSSEHNEMAGFSFRAWITKRDRVLTAWLTR